MLPRWVASPPSDIDFSCGFQFSFSSGSRHSNLLFVATSWSYSASKPSRIAPMRAQVYPALGQRERRVLELLHSIGAADRVRLNGARDDGLRLGEQLHAKPDVNRVQLQETSTKGCTGQASARKRREERTATNDDLRGARRQDHNLVGTVERSDAETVHRQKTIEPQSVTP